MELAGIADVDTDWRLRVATKRNGFRLYGADGERAEAMQRAGLDVDGTLDDLIERCDIILDCTPKRVGAKNAEIYRRNGIKFSSKAARSTR
jgi:glyceraldehyde-3-phosphate dehydrogenase (NAD(P))